MGPEPAEAVGPWLARQRELRGIDRAELARMTRIPIRSLERLESGAFDARPDGFTRGFVRTVATAIGLDPDDAVARLLPEPAPRRRLPVASLGRWAAAFGVLLALLATGFVLWRLLASWTPTEVIPPDRGPRLRRDPVRALAEEQALLPPPAAGPESLGPAAATALENPPAEP